MNNILHKLKIKNVEISDLDSIVKIEEMSFENPWSRTSFEEELKSKSTTFLVAKINNELVGYIIIRYIDDEGYILNIAVHPEFRSLGIGKLLMKQVLEIANKLKLKNIYLEVRESNIIAKKLYHNLGFIEVGKRKRYYDNENGIIMWKKM